MTLCGHNRTRGKLPLVWIRLVHAQPHSRDVGVRRGRVAQLYPICRETAAHPRSAEVPRHDFVKEGTGPGNDIVGSARTGAARKILNGGRAIRKAPAGKPFDLRAINNPAQQNPGAVEEEDSVTL